MSKLIPFAHADKIYDIDIDFFVKTWPCQGIKMTLTEISLEHLSENIKYLHSLGFCEIGGVNLFEGQFDWSDERYIKIHNKCLL